MENNDELEKESPAIRALGPLFKLTQVHFWVDLYTGMPYGSNSMDCLKTAKDDAIPLSRTESNSSFIDTELSSQMNELGLPLSFCTNKQKGYGKVNGKRNDAPKIKSHNNTEVISEVTDSIKLNECKIASPAFVNNNMSRSSYSAPTFCLSESLSCGIAVGDNVLQEVCGEGNYSTIVMDDMQMEATPEHVNIEISTDIHVDGNGEDPRNGWFEERLEDPLVANRSCEVDEICSVNIERPEEPGEVLHTPYGEINDGFGDWITCWDEFYETNYYYNCRTQESTWEPPPGMEHLASVYVPNVSKEDGNTVDSSVSDVTTEQLYNEHLVGIELTADSVDSVFTSSIVSCSDVQPNEPLEVDRSTQQSSLFDSPDTLQPTTILSEDTCDGRRTSKRKKKVKRVRAHRKLSADNREIEADVLMEDYFPTISKYWCQRYVLFSKYDDGIKMDEEGWFSATPECIAKHHALRCGSGIVVDCFTGVGGNAIRLAPKSTQIIAIDIDPKKIEYAQHNAAVYGVEDHIEFITGDCFILAKKLKADTVFLSPPWGGPEYAKARSFDINTMLKPHDGKFLFNVAKQIAPKVVMFLPRNVDVDQLAELSLSANPPWSLEVEKNFLNGNLKAITAYFTDPSLCK